MSAGQYGSEYEHDNKALGFLLKGVCLRVMQNSPLHAEECFKTVISMEKKIKEDRFLVPYAHVELAFLYKIQGNLEKAARYLETAKYDSINDDDDDKYVNLLLWLIIIVAIRGERG